MKRMIVAVLAIICSIQLSNAQIVDIITTRSGDIYKGYISKQIPGKSVTIQSLQTIMTVSSNDAKKVRTRRDMLCDLIDDYSAYFPAMPGETYVEIADVIVTDKNGKEKRYKECAIIEDGEDIKFASLSPIPCDIEWSDIKLSSKAPYDFSGPVYFYDRLFLNSGYSKEGQFLEQNLQSGLVRFRNLDGTITTYKKSKLISVRYNLINTDDNIWTRLPHCDRVFRRDGSYEDGIITSKVFGQNVTIQEFNSEITKDIPIGEIVSYEKYPNPLFVPTIHTKQTEDNSDLYVNGIAYPKQQIIKERDHNYVTTSADSLKAIVNVGEKVTVKYKIFARTSSVAVVKTKLMKERVLGLSGLKVKDKGTSLWPVFTNEDILVFPDINFQSNDGKYIVADIAFDSPGVYLLWMYGTDECVAINVK